MDCQLKKRTETGSLCNINIIHTGTCELCCLDI